MGSIAIIVAPKLSFAEREASVKRMLHACSDDQSGRDPVASFGPCTFGAIPTPGVSVQEAQAWMASCPRRRYHATVCGELGGGPELLTDLGSHGVRTADISMPGLVSHAFALFGGASLRRFRGAYGMAVWDEEQEQLLLARDALGLRQLFYSQQGSILVASTELRAVCASGLVPHEIAEESVRDCVLYGTPTAPRTIYQGILAARPGECLTWREGMLEVKTYWTFRDIGEATGPQAPSPAEFLQEFRHRLQTSLRRSLGSSMLTGCAVGNDASSCLLAGSAARATTVPLRTFSLCYADEQHQVEDLGPRIARHFGTRHETVLINGDDVARDLDHLLASYDQPGDEPISSFYLGRKTAEAGLSVLLAPIGADSVFGLHDWFRPPPLATSARLSFWQSLAQRWSRLLRSPHARAKDLQALQQRGGSLHELAALQRRWVTENERESFLAAPGPFRAHEELEGLSREVMQEQVELVASAWDLRTRLSPLEVADHRRAAASHLVSLRFPFLDTELLSWCRAYPGAARQSLLPSTGLPSAWSDLLLEDIKLRPHGETEPPYATWWHGPLRGFAEHTFSTSNVDRSGFFRSDAVHRYWQQALQQERPNWRQIWRLAVLINFVNRRVGKAA